ncbi:MAG: DUF2961 domain-containing protein [Chitinophagaceae bacterium]|nr:MAG: DUF2961 domain-containing protein [Chitinophagaceae bacterium]
MMKNKEPISRRKAISTVASLSALFAMPAIARNRNEAYNDTKPLTGVPLPVYSLRREGRSRQFTTFDPKTKNKAYPIQPGEKKDLVNYEGAGIITRMWMTFSGWFWMYWEPDTYIDQTILKKLILRIYWDRNNFPSVEAPIGDFFGVGQCEYKQYLSKYLGMSSGGFYNYFPMPFAKGVRIEVENMHDKVIPYVFLNANYQALDALSEDAGRFQCLYNAGANPGSEPMAVLKTTGKGHYVGCCVSLQGKEKDYLSFLEAPEYFYIDTEDQSVPTMVGTGMEDYFNGGWYFREGEFNGMYHGVPIKDALRSMITMYRFHEEDVVCFDKSIEMSFINPRMANQLKEFKFSSTAYWYQDKASKLAFALPSKDKLVDWYRIRNTDHQSIP